jgi:hypothetical protein
LRYGCGGVKIKHKMANKLNVYLEVGSRRTFAAALDWPGWCRIGGDEATALQALFEYSPRYQSVLRPAGLGFQIPGSVSDFVILERLSGNATTDFGAPGQAPSSDTEPVDEMELQRLQTLLKACWRAFDAAIEVAHGKTLRSGPRGGGRDLDGIIRHVLEAEGGYLSALGGKAAPSESDLSPAEQARQAILSTLEASAHGEIPALGPRGGKRWSPRYFVRREAWHVLDHVWEIEDRLKQGE